VASHTFDLPLDEGENLICAVIYSGSGGFDFQIVGERGVGLASGDGIDPHRIDFELTADDGTIIERASMPLDLVKPIPAMPTRVDLEEVEPLAVLAEAAVTNFHANHPDQSRWYAGPDDLSAIAWLRQDGTDLLLTVAVTDDVAAEGDACLVVLADDEGQTLHEQRLDATVKNGRRWYRMNVSGTSSVDDVVRLNLRLLDDDGSGIGTKQQLDLGDVDRPASGVRLRLKS
jgi:hypothetical protein